MHMPSEPDFLLQNYTFALPDEQIAQQPALQRDASRLMTLDRATGATRIGHFRDICHLLPERCLLVVNNSRVIPARLRGRRPGGGAVELLPLTPLPLLKPVPAAEQAQFPGWQQAEAEALLRPAKKVRTGDVLALSGDFAVRLLEHGPYGRCRVHLLWQGNLADIFSRLGTMPLPPYIRRPPASEGAGAAAPDAQRYQTVYARKDKNGSVAAPTAGLHFTPELRERLAASGREWAELTLYVGYGTFSPVRSADIRDHAMHAEYVELPEATAQTVNRARREGRAVVAVGTTACRTLEGVYAVLREKEGAAEPLHEFSGWINTFLYPGRPFSVTDALITNFHLPGSSLLMLVAAFAGRERVLAAYHEAVERGFRFFSYGDSMLLL